MKIKKFDVLPRHIGFIMDGNGRWAKNQGLKRGEGHIAGAKVFKKIGEYCADLGIECVTFYAFSTENWSRPQEEVDGLMDLFIDYLILFHIDNYLLFLSYVYLPKYKIIINQKIG